MSDSPKKTPVRRESVTFNLAKITASADDFVTNVKVLIGTGIDGARLQAILADGPGAVAKAAAEATE